MNTPVSLADLAHRRSDELSACLRGAFEIELTTAATMHMSDHVWAKTLPILRAPRAAVERQQLVMTRDVWQGAEAIFNPLRSRRVAHPPTTAPSTPAAVGDKQPCPWCDRSAWHVANTDLSADAFGAVYASNGRVRAGPNWARQAPVSGVVFGSQEMHNIFTLSRADFCTLFEAAEGYVLAARAALPEVQYYEIFINGGPRSAASVEHAHAQVAGRHSRHFAYPEAIAARVQADYWDTVKAVHQSLGLAVTFDTGIAWANLVPAKERDITAVSTTLLGGAEMMHSILDALMCHGTNSFSLAAILAPGYAGSQARDGRFSGWPPVVWRLVDRGDANARHADIGCLELFGSAIVSTDPFEVARWLSEISAP